MWRRNADARTGDSSKMRWVSWSGGSSRNFPRRFCVTSLHDEGLSRLRGGRLIVTVNVDVPFLIAVGLLVTSCVAESAAGR